MSADKTPESERSQSSAIGGGEVPLDKEKIFFSLDHKSPAWDLLQYAQMRSGNTHADKVVPSFTQPGK